jgi:formiminotetrahydrofolate cyclodeaminase
MVCRVTARRTAPSDDLAQIDQEAETLRARLTALVQEDADAFAAVIEARRAPAERRPQAVRAALVRATEVPVEIASAARRILALCDRLVMSARASTVSDLGVAVILAAAALEGAALTARVNLRDLDDPAFVSRSRAVLAKLVEDAAVTCQRLAQVVAARTGIPA